MTTNTTLNTAQINRLGGHAREYATGISIPLYLTSKERMRDHFKELDNTANSNEEAVQLRRMVLADMMENTNKRGRWAEFYSGIEFIKENEWYWRELGYNDFETYWVENGGQSFNELADIEAVASFAKLINPKLFAMEYDDALRMYKQLADLAKLEVPKRGRREGSTKESITTRKRILNNKDDVVNRLDEANAYRCDRYGSKSLERRLFTLKRLHPEIAVKFLRGDYAHENAYGKWDVGMAAAELEAFGEVKGRAKAEKKVKELTTTNFIKWFNKVVNAEGLDAVIAALNDTGVVTVAKKAV